MIKLATCIEDLPKQIDNYEISYFKLECEGNFYEKLDCVKKYIEEIIKEGNIGLVLPQRFFTDLSFLIFINQKKYFPNLQLFYYDEVAKKVVSLKEEDEKIKGFLIKSEKTKNLYWIKGSAFELDIFGRLFYYGCFEGKKCIIKIKMEGIEGKLVELKSYYLPSLHQYGRRLPAGIQIPHKYAQVLSSPETSYAKKLFPEKFKDMIKYVEPVYSDKIDKDYYLKKYEAGRIIEINGKDIRSLFMMDGSEEYHIINYAGLPESLTRRMFGEILTQSVNEICEKYFEEKILPYRARPIPKKLNELLSKRKYVEIFESIEPSDENEEIILSCLNIMGVE